MRRVLPRTCMVHTPVTCTPNSFSMACRMAGLEASGATSKTYSPRAWYEADVRSETMGRTMVRCSVDMAYFPFFFLGAGFFAAGFFALDFAAGFAARFVVAFFAAAFL